MITGDLSDFNILIITDLISFGWGQFNIDEEAKLLDENKLRKEKPPLEKYVQNQHDGIQNRGGQKTGNSGLLYGLNYKKPNFKDKAVNAARSKKQNHNNWNPC